MADDARKRALRKLVRDGERQGFIGAMPITIGQAQSLMVELEKGLLATPCDHTLRILHGWGAANGIDQTTMTSWVQTHGGFCDCEVLANVAERIEDAGKLIR